MSNVRLLLGPIVFQDFEIPEAIRFGGGQSLAVHDLPGGQRVIDALGSVPADIGWSGAFSGPNATLRARTLDVLRIEGTVLPLSWDVYFYSVIIRELDAVYHNSAWVPYRLSVSVVLDPVQDLFAPLGSLADTALSDAGAAAGFATIAGVDLSFLQDALSPPDSTVLHTSDYLAASQAVLDSRETVRNARNDADVALGGDAQALTNAIGVAAMIREAGNSASLAAADAYLGRLDTNLRHASS